MNRMLYPDIIRVRELNIFTCHGVYEFEKRTAQNFYINGDFYCNLQPAGMGDSLTDTVSYGDICRFLDQFLTDNTFDLIETAAEKSLVELLNKYSMLQGADLEIRKPEAPVSLPFESVSVKIHREWNRTVIALGSNLGDKQATIQKAVDRIAQSPYFRNIAVSTLIETEPYGGVEQDSFLNGALVAETLYTPTELLRFLHVVEAEAGRTREIHWGPRTLDLDILFFEDLVMSTPDLTIPHTDMKNRTFVLEPVAELLPTLVHPVYRKTVTEMLEELKEK